MYYFWDSEVWSFVNLVGVLFATMLVANMIKRNIPKEPANVNDFPMVQKAALNESEQPSGMCYKTTSINSPFRRNLVPYSALKVSKVSSTSRVTASLAL